MMMSIWSSILERKHRKLGMFLSDDRIEKTYVDKLWIPLPEGEPHHVNSPDLYVIPCQQASPSNMIIKTEEGGG